MNQDILSKKGNIYKLFWDETTRLGYLTQSRDSKEYSIFSSFDEESALRNAKDTANQLDIINS